MNANKINYNLLFVPFNAGYMARRERGAVFALIHKKSITSVMTCCKAMQCNITEMRMVLLYTVYTEKTNKRA